MSISVPKKVNSLTQFKVLPKSPKLGVGKHALLKNCETNRDIAKLSGNPVQSFDNQWTDKLEFALVHRPFQPRSANWMLRKPQTPYFLD